MCGSFLAVLAKLLELNFSLNLFLVLGSPVIDVLTCPAREFY
jgi:hypothetical protein